MHPLIVILRLALTITCLFSAMVAKVPLEFANTRDFYHELGEETMQFLFKVIPLNPQTVEILGSLVANNRFNIQESYDLECKQMTKDRASILLNLIHDRKDLEMYLLGPACLSPAIINARKAFPHMWPPSGFPLLIDSFQPNDLSTIYAKDILIQSLNQPEWWQSSTWIFRVKWRDMDDLRFWRMIPPHYFSQNRAILSYLRRALFKTIDQPDYRELEELFIKSIRIPDFGYAWWKIFKRNGLGKTMLSLFSSLQDPWSVKVLDILKKMYSKRWKGRELFKLVLNSKLLQLSSWKSGPIDVATATNDILELFSVFVGTAIKKDEKAMIKEALIMFFEDIIDWSIVRPQLLKNAIEQICATFDCNFLIKHVDRMINNVKVLAILPRWLLEHSTNLQAYNHVWKGSIRSLRGKFISRAHLRIFNPYVELLYQAWSYDKKNWPGLVAAHEKVSSHIRSLVFNFANSEDFTWDPKIDRGYRETIWIMAFKSIKFDIDHGIPSKAVPSICFLRALLYYWKMEKERQPLNWIDLKSNIGEKCPISDDEKIQSRYQKVLEHAVASLFGMPLVFPKTNAELLQALIRGDTSESKGEKTNGLERRMIDLELLE